ncbi:MAG: metallophosphoesterase family protein [Acidimicrobiia bacterium]
MLVAQLSDTHLLADEEMTLWGLNTTRNLVAVLDALPPRVDVVVVTGDIAEDGTPEAYRRALSLTDGRAPQRYFVAGNHDDPDGMDAVLGSIEPLRMVRIGDHWTMALVNSQWVGHEDGRIADETLVELRDELARVTTHVVLSLHHPPISPCDNAACGMSDPDPLLEAIRGGPVRLVLSGHVHQQFDTTRRGVRFLGAPSTFRQLRHGGDPHYTDTRESPAAQLVELSDDGTATLQVIPATPRT